MTRPPSAAESRFVPAGDGIGRRRFVQAVAGQLATLPFLATAARAQAPAAGRIGLILADADATGRRDAAAAINAAIDAVHAAGGGTVWLPAGTYRIEAPVILKRGVLLEGAAAGQTILRLKPDANCNIVESYRFEALKTREAYQQSDDPDFTQDYGLRNLVLHGDKARQSTPDLLYGARLYGRRVTIERVIIAEIKGVGLATVQRGRPRHPFDWTASKTPGRIADVNIVGTLEEAWIIDGMSDLIIDHVVVNVAGDRDNDGTVPQTSRSFPGEEVHGIRLQAGAFEANYLNINAIRFGRGLFVNDHCRIHVDNLIVAGGWGNIAIGANCLGSLNSVTCQANPFAWPKAAPVAHPHIHNRSDDVQFDNILIRRVAEKDSGAPGILEEGGAMWQSVKVRQGNRLNSGHGIVINASDAQFLSIDIKGCGGQAAARYRSRTGIVRDGGIAAAIVIAGGTDLHLRARLANNQRGLVNQQDGLVGTLDIIADFASATDSVLEGVTQVPAIAGVVDTGVAINNEALRKSSIIVRDATSAETTWNSFTGRADKPWDPRSTAVQTATLRHRMWRTPQPEEVHLSLYCEGGEAPPVDYFVVSAIDATTLTLRLRLRAPLAAATATAWGASVR